MTITVAELAHESGLDTDEAIVLLWDAGLDTLDGPLDEVAVRQVPAARRALGLPLARSLNDPRHWMREHSLSEDAWQAVLSELGIKMSPRARKLPKGAVAKLRRRFSDVGRSGSSTAATRREEAARLKVVQLPPLKWRSIGRERDVNYLTAQEINEVHDDLVEQFADSEDPFGDPHGVREWHLLESSAFRPQTNFGEYKKYPTAEMAAAALLHSIIHNHPFHNGNKRTALVSMLVSLDRHDLLLTCSEEELFRFVMRTAQHNLVPRGASSMADREVLEIATWIRAFSRRVARDERPIRWHRLRRVLNGYDCDLQPAPKVGNRMNIQREIHKRTRLGRVKRTVLRTQVAYGDEGWEVDRDTLRKVRADLQLDEAHNVDSEAFYSGAQTPCDFIFKHQKTLERLAKL